MAKWADYLISKVRYVETATTKHIDSVFVHPDNDDSVGTGSDWKRTDVITKIDSGKTFCTITKNSDGNWNKGAKVEKVLIDGTYYLRTDANKTKKDNLGNLLEY
ncbi:MAG: DUF3892 domain-containing protein [bacterium]